MNGLSVVPCCSEVKSSYVVGWVADLILFRNVVFSEYKVLPCKICCWERMFLLQVCVNRVYNTVMHTMTCKQFSTMNNRTVAVTNPDEGVFTKNDLSHIKSRISQWQIMVQSQDKCQINSFHCQEWLYIQ